MKWFCLCVVGVIFVTGQRASADVIYTSYPEQLGASQSLSGTAVFPGAVALAEQFTPSTDYTFDSVKIGLQYSTGVNNFAVSLYDDAGAGGTPGNILETFSAAGMSPFPSPDVSLHSATHPLLTAGDNYYLGIVPGAPNTFGGWTQTPFGAPLGLISRSTNGGSTWMPAAQQTAGAMEIDGTPVPEPADCGVLLAVGVALLHRMSRREGQL